MVENLDILPRVEMDKFEFDLSWLRTFWIIEVNLIFPITSDRPYSFIY